MGGLLEQGSAVTRLMLAYAMWELREPLVTNAKQSTAGAKSKLGDRMFLEALLFLTRTGLPWRDLPSDCGDWYTGYQRFKRWR